MRKLTVTALTSYARDGHEFTAASMSGIRGAVADVGRLDGEWLTYYREDRERVDYTILSYSTPIAWHCDDGWTVVTKTYGKSSVRHQALTNQLYPRRERSTVTPSLSQGERSSWGDSRDH